MLVDEITLNVRAGKGGDGIVSWRREKYVSKGGPNGGDGGTGGDIYLVAVRDIEKLAHYVKNKVYRAEEGGNGRSQDRKGRNGESLELEVPVGTRAYNEDTREHFELLNEGDRCLVAAGGKGGFGNTHFKSSRNTTPEECTRGIKGQRYPLKIELSLIADAGLIGLPSAGKSTLLNVISNAQAKVGHYAFTTLSPNLGVAYGIVFADIPGLIEGASEGKGLGHIFLRHITRTKILLHLVPADSESPAEAYKTIRNELEAFDTELTSKKEIILLSKCDLISKDEIEKRVKELESLAKGTNVIPISAEDPESIKHMSDTVSAFINEESKKTQ